MKKLRLKYEVVLLNKLDDAEINPNKMNKNQLEDLKKRLKDYGEPNVPDPIFISKDNIIIGGHHRVQAARQLGWNEIRVTRVMNALTKTERMLLQRQHNKHGSPDDKLLQEYFAELQLISDLDTIAYELETDGEELKRLFDEPEESTIKKIEVTHQCPNCGFEFKDKGKKSKELNNK